jgi:PTH1 family peptidyl-tRNA hydrolase
MENLSLIVGLGNPGRDYAHTRHNAGFLVLDGLAARWRTRWTAEKKFDALLARAEHDGKRVILCKPQTFVNSSGEAAGAVLKFHKLPLKSLLVVVDDADLPFGEIRLRPRGSSGGHHGLESIEQHLGSREYARQRIGIGRGEPHVREITGYVLSPFRADEQKLLEKVLQKASEQIECWLSAGVTPAMNRFNGVVTVERESG